MQPNFQIYSKDKLIKYLKTVCEKINIQIEVDTLKLKEMGEPIEIIKMRPI